MRKLLEFIVAKRHWFVFLLCEILSFVLIYQNNDYQRGVMFSAANTVVGKLLSASGSIVSYINLRDVNHELTERNALLLQEVVRLRQLVAKNATEAARYDEHFLSDTVTLDSLPSAGLQYRLIPAMVVNNSTRYMMNYITIDKGREDGVRAGMGVVSTAGVAGMVMTAGKHYSVVVSLLHRKSSPNCKVRNTNDFGPLNWKGDDIRYAYLENLPTHSVFHIGDTVVTSGYSTAFPPGIMVGTVEAFDKQRDDNFFSLKVRLSTDFHSLSMVSVIDNRTAEEQKTTEKEARKND